MIFIYKRITLKKKLEIMACGCKKKNKPQTNTTNSSTQSGGSK